MSNKLSTFKINFENIPLLKSGLMISNSLHGTGIINLIISNQGIESITSNISDSCYKRWDLSMDKIGVTTDTLEKPIKCSIFKGSDFVKKIFAQLDKKDTTSYIIFHYDDLTNDVKQIEVGSVSTKSNRTIFTFKFNTSDVSVVFTEFDEEVIEFFFKPTTPATLLSSFKLVKDDLKQARTLLNLAVSDQTQNNYISVKFDKLSNQIIFTDEIANYRLSELSEVDLSNIDEKLTQETYDIDKVVFKLIDEISYNVELRDHDGSKFMIFRHINDAIDYVTVVPLLENIGSTVTYDEVIADKGTFG